ncbi:HI0074 family nucleotidyltransferase substrate-binding subunit [Candidatus Haliotispira prima]|uniref:HI0074 family nucleotidyltransferase substrate-binding subunit n=1 Tax=Candidatus Haliotispira prima TaxID=3034016 RepID=A0ABY8MNV0_9SPIO|nr:HI0074 family nucleotidyltransferase substrate-binding subunit [Candidatus Haliotispira prima]
MQRFECSWKLIWKTLKDYTEFQGIVIQPVTPREVIRSAVQAGIIDRRKIWMDVIDARNKMSHEYDFGEFHKIIQEIKASYLPLFNDVYLMLQKELPGE